MYPAPGCGSWPTPVPEPLSNARFSIFPAASDCLKVGNPTLEGIRNLRIVDVRFIFFETPLFTRLLPKYLDDEAYRAMQQALLRQPEQGPVMSGTGGFRKFRWSDRRRVREEEAAYVLSTTSWQRSAKSISARSMTRARPRI